MMTMRRVIGLAIAIALATVGLINLGRAADSKEWSVTVGTKNDTDFGDMKVTYHYTNNDLDKMPITDGVTFLTKKGNTHKYSATNKEGNGLGVKFWKKDTLDGLRSSMWVPDGKTAVIKYKDGSFYIDIEDKLP